MRFFLFVLCAFLFSCRPFSSKKNPAEKDKNSPISAESSDSLDSPSSEMNQMAESQKNSSDSEELSLGEDFLSAEKLLESLDGSDSRGIDGSFSESQEKLPPEFFYTKNDGSLRRFSYDGEQMCVWKEGDDTFLVSYYGKKIVRKRFDSLYRLLKEEKLKIGSSARKTETESLLLYEYEGDSVKPKKMVEEDFSHKTRREIEFDAKSQPVGISEGHYEASSKDNEADIFLNDKKTFKRYDSEGRLSEEKVLLMTYMKNYLGSMVSQSRNTKNVYDYAFVDKGLSDKPDLYFYENDELHLVRKYEGKSKWSEKVYFDGGFSVEVLYEDGIKKTEVIYMNEVEQRRRNFDD